jgi:HAD superfamily hydrolase (TIGR01662 family)
MEFQAYQGSKMDLYMLGVDGVLIERFKDRNDFTRVEILLGRKSWVNQIVDSHRQVAFALVSNQDSVALGFESEQTVSSKMASVVYELGLWRCPVTVHISFEHPNAVIEKYKGSNGMRKPGPGMLLEALKAHGVGKQDSLFVGDMETDEQAALVAQVPYRRAEEFFHGY